MGASIKDIPTQGGGVTTMGTYGDMREGAKVKRTSPKLL